MTDITKKIKKDHGTEYSLIAKMMNMLHLKP